jgi:hypothetical protein
MKNDQGMKNEGVNNSLKSGIKRFRIQRDTKRDKGHAGRRFVGRKADVRRREVEKIA